MAAKVLGLASYFADRRQPEIIHAKLRSEVRLEAISDLEFSVGIGDGVRASNAKLVAMRGVSAELPVK